MDHMNNVLSLVKLINSTQTNDKLSYINVVVVDRIIPILINNKLPDTINKFYSPNDTIGRKGIVCVDDNKVIIFAERILFLQSKRAY